MLDKQILYISTPLTMKWKNHCYTASGFFFQYSSPNEENELSNYWLVTNRHVIYAEDKEKAWKDYLALCNAGGSKSYLGLLKVANLHVPFEDGCVKESISYAKEILLKAIEEEQK